MVEISERVRKQLGIGDSDDEPEAEAEGDLGELDDLDLDAPISLDER